MAKIEKCGEMLKAKDRENDKLKDDLKNKQTTSEENVNTMQEHVNIINEKNRQNGKIINDMDKRSNMAETHKQAVSSCEVHDGEGFKFEEIVVQ